MISMHGLELRETTRYGKALFAGAHLRKSLSVIPLEEGIVPVIVV